ncbi:unnamed protein product [Anisakis simplex]|uniref:2-aminoethanethiol dioxygenase n=1 Tax=Anisakis simplex TaxID=6269 RepID=A0A0M3K0T1_ANISI|nr:unnamed protein product [Anisakis simplex]
MGTNIGTMFLFSKRKRWREYRFDKEANAFCLQFMHEDSLVMMERHALRHFLKNASHLAHRLSILSSAKSSPSTVTCSTSSDTSTIVSDLCALMNQVTAKVLAIELPDDIVLSYTKAPFHYADIYEDHLMHACLFGFTRKAVQMPLHDHSRMHGFVKVIRGSMTVSSYSWLSEDDEQRECNRNIIRSFYGRPVRMENTYAIALCESARALSEVLFTVILVLMCETYEISRYEGTIKRNSEDECVHLDPERGNLHSMEALEAGTTFFDLLVPGYGDRPCTFYEIKPGDSQLNGSDICFVRTVPMPTSYYCETIPYDQIFRL